MINRAKFNVFTPSSFGGVEIERFEDGSVLDGIDFLVLELSRPIFKPETKFCKFDLSFTRVERTRDSVDLDLKKLKLWWIRTQIAEHLRKGVGLDLSYDFQGLRLG